jgi:N-carbamoylputrescine amidase
MRSTRVAAVSMNGRLGEPVAVLEEIAGWCGRAAAERADLVLFPELVVHGHCTPNTAALAETVPDGPSVTRLVRLAREHGLVLSAGLSEREGDTVYNTQVLVGPGGYIGKQRKLHLSRDEVLFYTGGRDLRVFDVGPCKVGIAICYDNEFPELPRILALLGADVLLMPHASRDQQWEDTPESEAKARRFMRDYYIPYALGIKANAVFGVLTDQAGRAGYVDAYPRDHENQPHHPGAAMIFGPDGRLVAASQMERIRDEMVVATLDAALLEKERAHPNYQLRTRRPDLYGEILRDRPPSP